jgi:hypothetical protein
MLLLATAAALGPACHRRITRALVFGRIASTARTNDDFGERVLFALAGNVGGIWRVFHSELAITWDPPISALYNSCWPYICQRLQHGLRTRFLGYMMAISGWQNRPMTEEIENW